MTIKDMYFVIKFPSENIKNMQNIYIPVAMNMQRVNKRTLFLKWVKILPVKKKTGNKKPYIYSLSF